MSGHVLDLDSDTVLDLQKFANTSETMRLGSQLCTSAILRCKGMPLHDPKLNGQSY